MGVDLPLSGKDVVRFTPAAFKPDDPTAPVYLIGVPTGISKAKWRRDVTREGARGVSYAELHACLKEAVPALILDEQGRAKALEDIETTAAVIERISRGEKPEDEDWSAFARIAPIEQQALRDWPPYAEKQSDQNYALEIQRLLAAKHFLRGWENVEAKFNVKHGLVTDDSLSSIPPDHVVEIGLHALGLMALSGSQKKS